MQLKKGQIIELEIYTIAFGGAGLGKFEGLSVFVAGTMPGDKVKAALTKIKSNFAEAQLVEVVEPAKDRLKPVCKHFGVCGGCQFQFMPYEQQLAFKKQHVIDSFERIGKIYNPPVEEIIGCEDSYFYRNKMEFSFGHDANMQQTLGLHMPERRYDIMDVEECFLESRFSVLILNKVREFVLEHGWKPFRVTTLEGFLRSLYIREGKRTGEMMINLVTNNHVPEDFKVVLKVLVEELLKIEDPDGEKKITSFYWSQQISKRGSPNRIVETLMHGKKTLTEKMILANGDELVFEILPQAFFQVNTKQAEILYSQVVEFGLAKQHKLALDLFCGTGTIGLFLAKHVERVMGIELNPEAIKAAEENARANKIFNTDFYCGDVGKVLNTLKEFPSLIVVDPPRAGLTEGMIAKMNEFGAEQIIYVSCNPATLARDCAWLGEFGYKLKRIKAVDMFPQTYHIECVCLLERG
ncbi:MAG: 23S rRNA (uracil(1939)-C(5))-methyltransferase RlmD [Patescibacteria group bacterium]